MSFPFCAVLSGLTKHTLSRAVLPGRGCPFVHRLHAGDAPTGSTPGGCLGGRVMGHVTVLAQVTLVLMFYSIMAPKPLTGFYHSVLLSLFYFVISYCC